MVGEVTKCNSAWRKYVTPLFGRLRTPRSPEKSGGRFAFTIQGVTAMTDEDASNIVRLYLKEKPLLPLHIKRALLTVLYRNEIYRGTLQNIANCRFDDPVKNIHMVKILSHQALNWNI